MNRFKRQKALIDIDVLDDTHVTVVGVGGIGSWAATALARLGVHELTLVDPDEVEDHNLASQNYKLEDVGSKKVYALSKHIEEISDALVESVPTPVTEYTEISEICVSGLDSLDARRELWQLIKTRDEGLYVDARMGGELMSIHTVDMSDDKVKKSYENALFGDIPPSKESCSARSIVYNTQVVGGLVALKVKQYLMENEMVPVTVFDLSTLQIL